MNSKNLYNNISKISSIKRDDLLQIREKCFSSRLFIGTARYPNQQVMIDAVKESGAEVVTVSVRRMELHSGEENIINLLGKKYHFLPNTAGCFTAKDAVLTSELARESLETDWIKLEVIGDEDTLLPDTEELLIAAKELVKKKFVVLPYCSDDPVVCKRLEDLGCAAVMPLGAPIGSGMGIRNMNNIEIIVNQCTVPVIVDAGVGTASDVAIAMELGCDGVLLNSAVARSNHPINMAKAMRLAIEAGRLAYRSGRIPKQKLANSSTSFRNMISKKK